MAGGPGGRRRSLAQLPRMASAAAVVMQGGAQRVPHAEAERRALAALMLTLPPEARAELMSTGDDSIYGSSIAAVLDLGSVPLSPEIPPYRTSVGLGAGRPVAATNGHASTMGAARVAPGVTPGRQSYEDGSGARGSTEPRAQASSQGTLLKGADPATVYLLYVHAMRCRYLHDCLHGVLAHMYEPGVARKRASHNPTHILYPAFPWCGFPHHSLAVLLHLQHPVHLLSYNQKSKPPLEGPLALPLP